MKISVAIPTYKRATLVIEALNSILEQKYQGDYEILILDNACDKDLQDRIKIINQTTSKIIHYIPIPEIGLHNGRNAAAIHGQGEIIVYIDDDIIAPPDWLQNLCEPFQDPDVMGVAGKTVPRWEGQPPDWIQQIDPSYFSLLDLGDTVKEIHYPQTPYGCNMAYRRRVILELGGFPPDGVGGGEIEWKRGDGETGFAYKVYQKKYKIVYTPKGFLCHRIFPRRMTIDYLKNRTMKGAISGFYSEYRNHHSSYLIIKEIPKNLIKYLIFQTYLAILFFKPPAKKVKYYISSTHFKILILYQIRILIDKDLQAWIKQENYW